MPVGAMITGAVVSGGAAVYGANKADDAARREGERADKLEREKFAEAKRQAEILRQRGDEAAAVALEEGAKAELGAQKFEALSNEYGQRADEAAKFKQAKAVKLYNQIQDAAKAREAAGEDAATAIRGAYQSVMGQARLNEGLQDEAFGNIEGRFSPFLSSESAAANQLMVEQGLAPGEVNRTYRDSPAYAAALDASRVAEEDAFSVINQDAANAGTLYSGTRGAALIDRAKRGSYERAGIEQSYYQNYINLLSSMANPTATGQVSGFEANKAGNVGSAYLNAGMSDQGARLNAEQMAQNARLSTMRTGAEGSELINYLDPGTASAPFVLGGVDPGTAGSPYRLRAQDYRVNAAGGGANLTVPNMPTGDRGAAYRFGGVEASNAALADGVAGVNSVVSNYLRYGQPNTYGGGYGPSYTGPYQPPTSPYLQINPGLA